MTEAQWLTSCDPARMLEHVCGIATHRQRILFGIACCRSIWNRLTDERARAAVEVTDRWIDGYATLAALESAQRAIYAAFHDLSPEQKDAARAAHGVVAAALFKSNKLHDVAELAGSFDARGDDAGEIVDYAWAFSFDSALASADTNEELARHCGYVRDIFGNPFRPSGLDPRASGN